MVRFKNRYFTTEIIPLDNGHSAQPLNLKTYDILKSVLAVTEQIHGEFGAAAIKNGLEVKYCNESTQIAIIRCRHGPHRLLASSLPFLSSMGKRKVQLQSMYTGATLVKCYKFLKKFHQDKICEALKMCKTEQEKKKVLGIMSKTKYGL
uniref:Ribonuclease P/MRP protein subunit POP5 n=1 Tax=Daphnia similis TaxID=35528 RepID=A0A4Y7LN33_9CRUS|nr:EOG090X0GYO [Daphnia similis]SVE71397.1 EOG090X0GYO [Daphnia similis]SVE72030.1 EOG090X0GYO [Daphnia similis]SVE72657.1 EOG090X0GYO [Daphnia similis]